MAYRRLNLKCASSKANKTPFCPSSLAETLVLELNEIGLFFPNWKQNINIASTTIIFQEKQIRAYRTVGDKIT